MPLKVKVPHFGVPSLNFNGALRKKIHYNPDTKEDEAVISFVDGVVGLYAMAGEKCSKDTARNRLNRWKSEAGANCPGFEKLTFPGPGQRETPAGTFAKFLEVAAQLPGLCGWTLRHGGRGLQP